MATSDQGTFSQVSQFNWLAQRFLAACAGTWGTRGREMCFNATETPRQMCLPGWGIEFIKTLMELTLNRKDLQALNLVGPTH